MIKIITKKDSFEIARMDAFLRSHAKGHFLQSPQWASVKSKWDWQGILVYSKGALTGAMSLLLRRLPFGASILYAPRGPVCNRNDGAILNELFSAVREIARRHRALLLYLDPDEPDSNQKFRNIMTDLGFQEKSDTGFGNLQPQYVFRLDLHGATENALFGSFSAKTRYNIRIALRKGVTVKEFSGADRIPEYELTCFSMLMDTTGQRDGFRVRNKEYFRKLLQSMKDNSRLFIAYYQEQPIAGAIEIIYGNKAWYLYGASGNEHRDKMPNYLLQWSMIRYAIARGCTLYDFRGVPGEPSKDDPLYGLYRFKKGFSGTYTKFTGLYTYSFRPIFSAVFFRLQKLRRSAMHIKQMYKTQ